MNASIAAIVPTVCTVQRAASLVRAIDSLKHASVQPIRIIIVVNGQRFDEQTLVSLKSRRDVQVLQLEVGSLPYALLEGRRNVSEPFFCFLDDDDILLPGVLDTRLAMITKDPALDLVISNGYREVGGKREIVFRHKEHVSDDPLAALFRENWLPSCGGLFRTTSVGIEFFEQPHQYLEWTWLAYRLAVAAKKIAILPEPGFVVYDTPDSLSKSMNYRFAHVDLYRRMLDKCSRDDIRHLIFRRLAAASHDASVGYLELRSLKNAWKWHLKSLNIASGWRYSSYTARLLLTTIGTVFSART